MSKRRGVTDAGWIRAARLDARLRQGKRCFWCMGNLSREECTAEHIVPRKAGGTDTDNIAAAHRYCNLARGHIPKARFKRMLTGGIPCPTFEIRMVAMSRRINRRADLAVKRIYALVGKAA